MRGHESAASAELTAARDLAGEGKIAEAIVAFTSLLQRHPGELLAVLDLGALLRQQGHASEAARLYRGFAQRGNAPAELWVNLGNAEATLGETEAAMASYRQALAINSGLVVAARYLGRLLLAANRLAEALPFLQQAASANPRDPATLEQLAKALRRLERWGEAVGIQARIAALKPEDPAAEAELARALVSAWQLRSGIVTADRAIARDPRSAIAWLAKAEALSRRGFPAESRAAFDRATALQPGSTHIAQCRLHNLLYDDRMSAPAKAEEHRRVARLWNVVSPSNPPFPNTRDPTRRLRVGYVTPDLRLHHPVSQFLEAILRHHDPVAVEVFLYSTFPAPDATSQRFQAMPVTWRDLSRHDDRQAAAMIAGDRIDLLIDLSGHTGGGRMGLFARRPAPIQATYLGYSHSTGIAAMDYAIVDREVAPPGSEALYSERLLRLSPSLFCFTAPTAAPPVSERPVGEQPGGRPIVFASYNNGAKLSPSTIDLWIRLLRAVPEARLRFKAAIFADDYEVARFTALFAGGGVDANRLDFAPLSPTTAQMLAEFALVDIALDPIPYNGATTTCLALWMGVPVVSLAGEGYSSRMGASLLKALGQPDWVATTPEEYIAIASRLAHDRAALQRHRSGLRQQMQASPLMDGVAFTRKLETLYRQAWRDWCAA
jgi:protein O-GlcNAc transferase